MNRRTKGVLLAGGLVAAAAVAAVVGAAGALERTADPHHYCESGFSKWIDCTYRWSSRTIYQGTPLFTAPSSPPPASEPDYTEAMSWAVARCPQNNLARRLLCAVPPDAAPVQAASDDVTTGLPRPKPWFVMTAKDSTHIKTVHLETPLDLAATLGFYRAELKRRGWTENGVAAVEPEGAVIAFTTSDGPALLRLVRHDDRTSADLSLRKPAATHAAILSKPGQARLLLGNATDEAAVITVNAQTVELAAGVGSKLTDDPRTGSKSPDSPEVDLPPGKYKVTLKTASGKAQQREFEVVANETWGLLAGPAGVPLPIHLY